MTASSAVDKYAVMLDGISVKREEKMKSHLKFAKIDFPICFSDPFF